MSFKLMNYQAIGSGIFLGRTMLPLVDLMNLSGKVITFYLKNSTLIKNGDV